MPKSKVWPYCLNLLYFAYGSNMSSKRLMARTPSAKFVAIAQLAQHELKFHKLSKDGSGKCDIAKTDDQHKFVIGVLYSIDENEKLILDRYEGLGQGYEQKLVEVMTPDGQSFRATSYYAAHIEANLKPYHWYKEHVLRGAKENQLSSDYIKVIESIQSIADPDGKREKKELETYK